MTYPMQHPDLDQMICEHHDVPGQDLECYFEAYTGSLWFVYVNGGEIHELLRDSVIQTLEAAYAKACKEEAEEENSALPSIVTTKKLESFYET